MERLYIFATVIFLMTAFNVGLFFGEDILDRFQNNEDLEVDRPEHEHALFFVVVDNKRITFLEDKYQLASKRVHLENNRSDIVHKHVSEIKWNEFLSTINISYNKTGEEFCLDAKNVSRCGNGTALLNGEEADLQKEIEQGDNFVIALGYNHSAQAEKYSQKEVPEPWQDPATYGRRI